jgi:hypothetical protein
MSQSEDETRGFKVTDRRKFTSEGKPRNDEEASGGNASDEQAPEAASPSLVSKEIPAVPPPRPVQSSQEAQQVPPSRDVQTATAEAPSELSFVDLVSMLATNALVQLGEVPDPASGEKMENLRAAQDMISFLEMLQKKTEGNLDKNEEEALEQIVYDLRMRYMAKANILKL